MTKLLSTHQPTAAMLPTTQKIRACQARVGCQLLPRLNAAASCLILAPSSSSSSRRPCSSSSRAAAAAAPTTVTAAPAVPLSFADRPGVWDSHSSRLQLKSLTFEELEEWCASMGEFHHPPAPPAWHMQYACSTRHNKTSASSRTLSCLSITCYHCRPLTADTLCPHRP